MERWEEQAGYSPSTIAAEIAGLTAASAIAAGHGDKARARLYQATADDFQRNVKSWTVTTTGPDAPSYFIQLSKTGDPNAAISYGLSGERAESDIAAGNPAAAAGLLNAMLNFSSGVGLVPEQAWEDPSLARPDPRPGGDPAGHGALTRRALTAVLDPPGRGHGRFPVRYLPGNSHVVT